jgi:hypothetical protein
MGVSEEMIATVEIKVEIMRATLPIQNCAQVQSRNPDPNRANNEACVSIRHAGTP